MLTTEVRDMLEQTSRTFFLSITRLPDRLQEAIAAGYLCMRAIDDIEDHPEMDSQTKAEILHEISFLLQSQISTERFEAHLLTDYLEQYPQLPLVSRKLADWANFAPAEVAPIIWHNTSAMADRMAYWAKRNWKIHSQTDLDGYTFSVAGTVGLMICDLWQWYASEGLDRHYAVYFGRALQLVNIIRNHQEDLQRGVNFFPTGWELPRMIDYARQHLNLTRHYLLHLQAEPFKYIIHLPLELASATLDAIERGDEKLGREFVTQLVQNMGV